MAERRLEPNELAEAGPSITRDLPLDLIDPNPANPRRTLQEVDALAESIGDPTIGLLQPILVRRMGERYEVLAGHRRRAAYLLLAEREPANARWKAIAAVVRTSDDQDAYAQLIASQAHAKPWTAREEAAALEVLAVDHTLVQIGAMLHKSHQWVGGRLKIYADVTLSAYVQTGRLPVAVAQELLPLKQPDLLRQYADRAVAESWSHVTARAEVRKLRLDRQVAELGRQVTALLDLLSSIDGTKIPIEAFRDLYVLRGRIDVLGQQARGESGPRLPTIEQAERAAGVKPGQPDRKVRRTRLRID